MSELQLIEDETIVTMAGGFAQELRVTPDLHKDDFIFQFLIENPCFDSSSGAVRYYFFDGRKSANKLGQILDELQISKSRPFTLLEFASGYGCVTRHLHNALPMALTVSCDIHAKAIQFISERLSVVAIPSCDNPEEFSAGKKYDVVFALSFFSHMPRETWGRWLRSLYESVAPGGALVFTTQGLGSRKFFGDPQLDSSGYWFRADSEQKDLDVATYGQTIVSEAFVREEVERVSGRSPDLVRLGYWWEHQDCYVVRQPDF